MSVFHVFTVNRAVRQRARFIHDRNGWAVFHDVVPKNSNKSLFIDIGTSGSHADGRKALPVWEDRASRPKDSNADNFARFGPSRQDFSLTEAPKQIRIRVFQNTSHHRLWLTWHDQKQEPRKGAPVRIVRSRIFQDKIFSRLGITPGSF
jgi:hypothetical protein